METKNDIIAELEALPPDRFLEKLRGIYRIPINDGAGPLNGANEIVRHFDTGPIQHAAANRIEALMAEIEQLKGAESET